MFGSERFSHQARNQFSFLFTMSAETVALPRCCPSQPFLPTCHVWTSISFFFFFSFCLTRITFPVHPSPVPTLLIGPCRIQQQYSRPFIRGNSGSYVSEDRRSFDERSEDRSDADFSETNSSAQYYQHNQRPSFMSASSQGDSFDEYQWTMGGKK